jgi:hypothetical protein
VAFLVLLIELDDPMVRELNAFTRTQNRLAGTELLAWSSSNDLFATFLFSNHDKTPIAAFSKTDNFWAASVNLFEH